MTDFLSISRLGDIMRHKALIPTLLEGFLTSKCGIVRIDYRRGQNLWIRAMIDPTDHLKHEFNLDAEKACKVALKHDVFWQDVPTFPVLEGHWPALHPRRT